MTAHTIAAAYLRHYPDTSTLTTEDLEASVRNYVQSSYGMAIGAVTAARSFGKQPKQSELELTELLSPYLHDVSPIVRFIRPRPQEPNQDVKLVIDIDNMTMEEYSSYRNTLSFSQRGNGLFS